MGIKEQRFQLRISLNTLENLGINLYSNIASVLSEIVANSYDADATKVEIDLIKDRTAIVIRDDGDGMTKSEVNDRFLTVGYRRRDLMPGLTTRQRMPMGRKGIGKLSVFSIAEVVEIETAKDGERSAFRMSLSALRSQIEKEQQEGELAGVYLPDPISTDQIDFAHGTRITLSSLRSTQALTPRALRRRLARRFSIVGAVDDFAIYVEGQEVTPKDRDYYDKIEFMWTYGDAATIRALCPNARSFDRTAVLGANGLQISGWLGTVKASRSLKDEEGDNLNRVPIFVRGKMGQEDILSDFSERGVYANYLIGELKVESLDTYQGGGIGKDVDIATSSRQRFVEDDPRYLQLKDVLRIELKHIEGEWSRLRAEAGTKAALKILAVSQWIADLPDEDRDRAKRWIGRLNTMMVDDADQQKSYIKHAILGFEFSRLDRTLDKLDKIDNSNLSAALETFGQLDGLESTLYGRIVKTRVRVVETLREKVAVDALEKAIQEYLFDHLWLLDPSWERVDSTKIMEARFEELIEKASKSFSKTERSWRLDIKYRKSAGQHVVIELKRPGRKITGAELFTQISKYRDVLDRLLEEHGNSREPVEVLVVLGEFPPNWHESRNSPAALRDQESMKSLDARIVFYSDLLENAQRQYADYYKHRTDVTALEKVIAAIEDFEPGTDS